MFDPPGPDKTAIDFPAQTAGLGHIGAYVASWASYPDAPPRSLSRLKRADVTKGVSMNPFIQMRDILKLRLTVVIATLCLVLFWRDVRAATQPTVEAPTNRQASSFLPAGMLTSPHHQVNETVVCDGYMHRFTVESVFGVFHVTGDGALRKLVREIRAIAVLSKVLMGAAYIEGVQLETNDQAFFIAVDMGENMRGMLVSYMAEGELEIWRETLLQMAKSLRIDS